MTAQSKRNFNAVFMFKLDATKSLKSTQVHHVLSEGFPLIRFKTLNKKQFDALPILSEYETTYLSINGCSSFALCQVGVSVRIRAVLAPFLPVPGRINDGVTANNTKLQAISEMYHRLRDILTTVGVTESDRNYNNVLPVFDMFAKNIDPIVKTVNQEALKDEATVRYRVFSGKVCNFGRKPDEKYLATARDRKMQLLEVSFHVGLIFLRLSWDYERASMTVAQTPLSMVTYSEVGFLATDFMRMELRDAVLALRYPIDYATIRGSADILTVEDMRRYGKLDHIESLLRDVISIAIDAGKFKMARPVMRDQCHQLMVQQKGLDLHGYREAQKAGAYVLVYSINHTPVQDGIASLHLSCTIVPDHYHGATLLTRTGALEQLGEEDANAQIQKFVDREAQLIVVEGSTGAILKRRFFEEDFIHRAVHRKK